MRTAPTGLHSWGWRLTSTNNRRSFRLGWSFEVTPGDTIALVCWLGWWGWRIGLDWEFPE